MDSIPFSPSRLDASVFLEKRLKSRLKNFPKILDIGCGKLYLLNLLYDLKFQGSYLGIDLDPHKPTLRNHQLSAKIVKGDFLKFKTKTKFDLIVCLWTLEHIGQDEQTLSKVANMLADNSVFILAVPSIYSWPFEFGRHGFHYYTKDRIISLCLERFKILEIYSAGGLLGFVFMIIYNWLRFAILLIIYPLFLLISYVKIYKQSWKVFSKNVISSTIYRYHKSKLGITVHNFLVNKIVLADNYFKILPASYILFLKKNETA